VKINQF